MESGQGEMGVLLMVTLSDFQIKSELVSVESGLLRNFKDPAKKNSRKIRKNSLKVQHHMSSVSPIY